MSEYDNAGFPLAYCLLSTAESIEIGKRKNALTRWAIKLRDIYGIFPRFIHTDKDMDEIAMTRELWPHAKNQLCLWHARKAIRERLSQKKLSTTPYKPKPAHEEFNFIDITFKPFGSPDYKEYEGGRLSNTNNSAPPPTVPDVNRLTFRIPARPQPVTQPPIMLRIPRRTPHNEDQQNEETDNEEEPNTRRVFCEEDLRGDVIEMIENHYHAHPLIPGMSHPSAIGIRQWAVKEMYSYCFKHDLRELWAYLWENWYKRGRWELWARSSDPEIPRLKTTMIMESHWRHIKTDYLHHFSKPRADVLGWVLLTKLAPTYYRKLDLLLNPIVRYREPNSWRKHFKGEWQKLEKTPVTYPIDPKYSPNPSKWVCSCPYFVKSRFLLCKHLVHMMEEVPPEFFSQVQRNRTTPFWSHPKLVVLEKHRTVSDSAVQPDHGISNEYTLDPFDDDDIDDAEIRAADADFCIRTQTYQEEMMNLIATLRDFADGLEYQVQFRDHRMLETLRRDGAGLFRLANNCISRERRHNSSRSAGPRTWEQATSNAMFYRSRPANS